VKHSYGVASGSKSVPSLVGVILFFGGLELASSVASDGFSPAERTVLVVTAGLALWNMGASLPRWTRAPSRVGAAPDHAVGTSGASGGIGHPPEVRPSEQPPQRRHQVRRLLKGVPPKHRRVLGIERGEGLDPGPRDLMDLLDAFTREQ
jgi:hypothetical protein